MMILQSDQKTFQASQRPQRHNQDQGDPQHRVDPVRRLILDLGNQRGSDDDGAGDHNDEYGRPVASIGKAEIEAAHVTLGFQGQEPLKQLSLAAARPSTQKAGDIWRWRVFRDLLVRVVHLLLSALRWGCYGPGQSGTLMSAGLLATNVG